MTANTHQSRLASLLIKQFHGDITEKVCSHLISKGLQTLHEIVRGTGVPSPQVKQSLLLLIQHNYVSAYQHKDEDGPLNKPSKAPHHLYAANMDSIIQILRKPKMLLMARDEQGDAAEQIIELLLENGRLTFLQLVKAMAARQSQTEEQTREPVRNVLMSLVNFHYVERAPPCTMPPPTFLPHPNSVRGRRGKAAGSAEHAVQQARAVRGLEEMRYDHLRFKVPTDVILGAVDDAAAADMAEAGGQQGGGKGIKREREDGEGDEGEAVGAEAIKEEVEEGEGVGVGKEAAKGKGRAVAAKGKEKEVKPPPAKKARIKAGEKKVEVIATGTGAAAAMKDKAAEQAAALVQSQDGGSEVLWRVNYEEFNRRFRHALCVEMARDKFDADSATVLEAMLAAGRAFETQVKEDRGSQLNAEEVSAHLRRIWRAQRRSKEQDNGMEAEGDEGAAGGDGEEEIALEELVARVPDIINSLCNDPFEYVSYICEGPAGSQYCVNMVRFMDTLRLKSLEAVVRDKFGQGGMRIFRMLMERGQLEQKQVADFSMLPPKDTRETLYRMLRGGFVFMQDIPRTSDRAPSRTFYTWRVDWAASCERLAAELYRAAGNVVSRLQHEMGRCKELLALVDEAQATGTLTFTLTASQRGQLLRLQKVSRMLEGSLLQLDAMIALFNNY